MNRCYEYCLLKSPYKSFLYISFAILLYWTFLALQLQRLLYLPGFLTICSYTQKYVGCSIPSVIFLLHYRHLCSVPHSLSLCWGIRLCNRLWYKTVIWNITRYNRKKRSYQFPVVQSIFSGWCLFCHHVPIGYNTFDKNTQMYTNTTIISSALLL